MAIQKIPNTLIADNAVTASKIANGTLTADDIAANSITAAKLSASTSPTFGGLTVNNNVTINTDANSTLTIADGGADAITLYGSSGDELYIGANNAYKLRFKTDGNIVMDNGGSLGIGTSNPSYSLSVLSSAANVAEFTSSNTATALRLDNTHTNAWGSNLAIYTGGTAAGFFGTIGSLLGNTDQDLTVYATSGNGVRFYTNGNNRRVDIDSSGNLLVGNTDSTPYDRTSGNAIALGDGLISSAQEGGNAAIFNRMTNNGSITGFRYAGNEVGSWGSYSSVVSYLVLDPRTNGTGIVGLQNEIAPTNESGNPVDGAKDLGNSARRWKDLYLSGGAYLGGTGAANKLDDYEEGTWTPTSGFNLTLNSTCRYTKIGSSVTLTFDITYATGTDGNYGKISGLPFSSYSYSAGMIGFDTATNRVTMSYSAGSDIYFLNATTNAYFSLTDMSGIRLIGAITYLTAN